MITPALVLFGGTNTGSPDSDLDTPMADTWTFDGTVWAEVSVAGPIARYGHAMASLGTGRVMLTAGAKNAGEWRPAEVLVPSCSTPAEGGRRRSL